MTGGGVVEETFEPTPAAVSQLRAFLRSWLPESDPLTDSAVWLASELATNAVLHARSPFRLRLEVGTEQLRVAIEDDNPRMPSVANTDSGATSGRGLTIIDAVADRWGAESLPAGRKSIWFELTRHPHSQQDVGNR